MALEPLVGLRVVDLFAGSGALGIEALSRGASHVDFVEGAVPALRALEQNLDALGLRARATIWRARWPEAARRLRAALAECDVVLADPPYGGELARSVVVTLSAPGLLRDGARLVVEHHAKDALPKSAGRLQPERVRRYGETVLTGYRVAPFDPGPSRKEAGHDA